MSEAEEIKVGFYEFYKDEKTGQETIKSGGGYQSLMNEKIKAAGLENNRFELILRVVK